MNFEEAIALGKSRSDCHPDNIDTLVRLVKETNEISGDIVEIGSYHCGATIAMAAAAGVGKRVFAFDLFGGLPYGDGKGFENFAEVNFKEVLDTTASFQNIVLFKGLHEEVIPRFIRYSNFPLSVIFMDSDFYESHKVALENFWPLVSPSGVVVFHDWKFLGVQRAIKEIIKKEDCDFWGTLGSYGSPNMGMIRRASIGS